MQTANENVAKAYCDAVYSVYKVKPKLSVGGSVRPTYKVEVVSEAERIKVLASVDCGVAEVAIDHSLFFARMLYSLLFARRFFGVR